MAILHNEWNDYKLGVIISPLQLFWTLSTFTSDSISSVTMWAAITSEGPGNGGLAGNAGEAGRVCTGYIVWWFDPCGGVRVWVLSAGWSSMRGGGEHSGCSLVLWQGCGFPVACRHAPLARPGSLQPRPPVRGLFGWSRRWWGGRGGSEHHFLAGIWFDGVSMDICSAGSCPLTCKILQVRGYDLKKTENRNINLVCQ